ncbi:MAG: S41 family peptidase [Alicyclobacillus sp.]|nr:S41 family peptidase [Alicyclobacillus sp.]
MNRGTSFRVIASTLVLGLVIGSGGTLLGLKAANIALVPGTGSAAFQKFFSAYDDLHNQYYKPESNATLLDGAIVGMTQSLGDPFTEYFTPSGAQQFNEMLSSSFVGIGVTIQQADNGAEIVSVLNNSPAKQAGLHPRDVIVQVNGKNVEKMTVQQISNLVVGPVGSTVTIGVLRPGDADILHFTMKRAKVEKPSVVTKMMDHHVGYMQISVVASNTATEVQQGLAALKQQGMRSLVLDLRGNPGGYLDVAVQIASDFIPQGKVVVQTEDRHGRIDKITSKGPGSNLPVVVLMDEDTASAAEILSGALHEDDGAPLVGTRSYGKGTVQVTQSYSDGSSLKFTIQKWLTPDGEWINKKGLTPTYPVQLPSYTSLPTLASQTLPLQAGENDKAVQVLQQTLAALGYTVDRTDGYFDASTAAAVRQAQSKAGLPTTGVVDAKTAAAIDDAFAKLLSNSDTQLQAAVKIAIQRQTSP